MAANEEIFDAYVRQQVNLQRMSRKEAAELLQLLRMSDKELNGLIESTGGDWTKKRLGQVRAEVNKLRTAAWKSFGDGLGDVMEKTAHVELAASEAIMEAALPVEINFAAPNAAAVRSTVMGTPFGSVDKMLTLADWVVNLSEVDQARILGAVQSAVVNGETIQETQRRIMQVTDLSRSQAEALARTGINHASNTARNEFFKENAEVIQALRVVATLDGRTSPICRSYDGKMRPVEGEDWEGVPEPHLPAPNMSPPFHLRCRSLMMAILSGEDVASQLAAHERITVKDTRTGKERQVDFEKDARARYNAERKEGDPAWNDLPSEAKAPYRSHVRREWADEAVGRVPADTTYDTWLRKQDPAFQDAVLGKPRAEMYRNTPEMTMDTFIDADGNMLTIEQLDQMVDCDSPCELKPGAAPEPVPAPDPEPSLVPISEDDPRALTDSSLKNIRERGDPTEWYNANYQNVEEIFSTVRREVKELGLPPNEAAQMVSQRMRDHLAKLVPPSEDPMRYAEWLSGLTTDEREAFLFWGTEGMPRFIRDHQRGRMSVAGYRDTLDSTLYFDRYKPEGFAARSELLESALGRAPRYSGPAYRGAVTDWDKPFEVGQIIGGRAIASASYHGSIARDFAELRADQLGKQPVVFKYLDPVAVNVQNLTGELEITKEAELILLRGTKYRVEEVNQQPGFVEVILRAVPK